MNNEFLSQEEINSLLQKNQELNSDNVLTEKEIDIMGEVGNISMATSATTLSTILGKKVTITTPQVEVTNLIKLQENLPIPNVVLQVKFDNELRGTNILLVNVQDASIIANLMMGGDGTDISPELSDIELSAVSEAMNQMIGSASTSMATMLKREININPPQTKIWDSNDNFEVEDIDSEQSIVKIAFHLTVNDLIDSEIMQIFTLDTIKDIVNIMTEEEEKNTVKTEKQIEQDEIIAEEADLEPEIYFEKEAPLSKEPVSIKNPQFGELEDKPRQGQSQNIDLIMDVPLEFSVVLGKTQKAVRDVLSLSPGSVVELNKFSEEPLDVYVNGKLIAQGEVVVINENFGIRITNIISPTERVKKLK
jgi:flagellar motor switch protein FliN/FliY